MRTNEPIFYDEILSKMISNLSLKYGELSKISRINYCAIKHIKYHSLGNKIVGNDSVKELIINYINTHNDNSISYNSEGNAFLHTISDDVIDDICIILSCFYTKDYLDFKRLAKFNKIDEKNLLNDNILKKKHYDCLYNIYSDFYDYCEEEDKDFVCLSIKALLYQINYFMRLASIKKLPKKLRVRKAISISLKNLIPFFNDVYEELLNNYIILEYIDIAIKVNKEDNKGIYTISDFTIISDIYSDIIKNMSEID